MQKRMTRKNDYDTSIEAAELIAEELSELQSKVFSEISNNPQGLTDIELEKICNKKYGKRGQSTYRKRRTDLLHKGFIKANGKRKMSGPRSLTVWVSKV